MSNAKDNVMACFKAADANGDGTISEDELKAALLKIGLTEEEIKKCFQEADANKDGVIDYEEFVAWVYKEPHEAIKKMVAGARGLKSQATLDSLEEAGKMLSTITKGDITELKSLAKPPEKVLATLGAVATLFGKADDWKSCQKMIADSKFLENVLNFDVNSVTSDTANKLTKYTSREDFTVENVKKSSKACAGMCMWVLAIKDFALE